MLSRIRKQITPATVLAFVALIFAVTGGAFTFFGGGGDSGAKASAVGHADGCRGEVEGQAKGAGKPEGPRR